MEKLNTQGEHKDQQQEKHNAYLKVGYKLKSTNKKGGLVRRTYENKKDK